MEKRDRQPQEPKVYIYRAPHLYVGIFYLFLAAATIVPAYMIGTKATDSTWSLGQLAMIGFVLVYTCYFSLGIAYQVTVNSEGRISLRSYRRTVEVAASEVTQIEEPKLPIGFLRFKLSREKAYLFALMRDKGLLDVVRAAQTANPRIKLK